MLLETNVNSISGNYQPSDATAFTTELNSVAFEILSKGIYKDPIKAIVRELCANAHDAHICANNPKPFHVQAPTNLDPNFYIRDYGTGIPPEQINQIYFSYFSSNKRHTNILIGGKGLGSKTPLAYTDTYIVNNYYDGFVHHYIIYKDTNNCPAYSKTSTEPTKEPNGLEIIIAVQYKDQTKFTDEVKRTTTWFNCTSNIDIPQQNWLLKTPYGGILPKDNIGAIKYIVMGNIPYQFNIDNTTENSYDWIWRSNIYLFANIGDYPTTASRDQIVEDTPTNTKINIHVETFLNQIHNEVKNQLKGLPKTQAAITAAKLYWNYGITPPVTFTLTYQNENNQPENTKIHQYIHLTLPKNCTIWHYQFPRTKKWSYKQKTTKLDSHIIYDTQEPPILAHSIHPKKGNPSLLDKTTHEDHIVLFSNDPTQIKAFYALVPNTPHLDLSEHFKPTPKIKTPYTQKPRTPTTYNLLTTNGIRKSDTIDLSQPIWLIERRGTSFYINNKLYPYPTSTLYRTLRSLLTGLILVIQKTTPRKNIPNAPYLDATITQRAQQLTIEYKKLNRDATFFIKRQIYNEFIRKFTNAHKFKALGYTKQLEPTINANPIANSQDVRTFVNWLLNETLSEINHNDLQEEKITQQTKLQEKFPILKLIDLTKPIPDHILEILNQYI